MLRPGRHRKLPAGLQKWLGGNFIKIEVVLGTFFLASIILENERLIGIFGSSLAGLYFVSAFYDTKDKNQLEIIIERASSISWSIVIIGITFQFLNLPGHAAQLGIGILSCGVLLLLMIGEAINKNEFKRRERFMRTFFWSLMGTILYFLF